MKPHTPLLGYNNNIPHKGKMYHVQTEDQGTGRSQVATHLFADGGRVVTSAKTSYAQHLEAEDLAERVRQLMRDQHKAMVVSLRDGAYDHVIEASAKMPAVPPRPSQPQMPVPRPSQPQAPAASPSAPGSVVEPAAPAAPPRPPPPPNRAARHSEPPHTPLVAGQLPEFAPPGAFVPPPPRAPLPTTPEGSPGDNMSSTLPIGTSVPIEVLEAAAADADSAFYREIQALTPGDGPPPTPPLVSTPDGAAQRNSKRATPHHGGSYAVVHKRVTPPAGDNSAGSYRFITRSSRSGGPPGSDPPLDQRGPFGASVVTDRPLDAVMLDFLAKMGEPPRPAR